MSFSKEQLRRAVQFSEGVPAEPAEASVQVEAALGLALPPTLKQIHCLSGGATIREARCHKQPYGHPTENCDLYALATNPLRLTTVPT